MKENASKCHIIYNLQHILRLPGKLGWLRSRTERQLKVWWVYKDLMAQLLLVVF